MVYSIKSFKDLRLYIASDLFRYLTSTSIKAFLRGWYITGFRYTFFMRCCKYFANKGFFGWLPFFICRVALRHYSITYGFQIPWQTNIGPGLNIGHFGPIIVNPSSTIGVNCNISVGVLLGLNHNVDEKGKSLGFQYPSVGDRVALSNGVKIIGDAHVEDDCLIGVNTVVTRSIPKHCVAVGQPAKVISERGSSSVVGSFHPFTKTERFCK